MVKIRYSHPFRILAHWPLLTTNKGTTNNVILRLNLIYKIVAEVASVTNVDSLKAVMRLPLYGIRTILHDQTT